MEYKIQYYFEDLEGVEHVTAVRNLPKRDPNQSTCYKALLRRLEAGEDCKLVGWRLVKAG